MLNLLILARNYIYEKLNCPKQSIIDAIIQDIQLNTQTEATVYVKVQMSGGEFHIVPIICTVVYHPKSIWENYEI